MNEDLKIIGTVFENLQNSAEDKIKEIKHLTKYLKNQRQETKQTINEFEKEYYNDVRELSNLTYNLDDDIENMLELNKLLGDEYYIIEELCNDVCKALEEEPELRNLIGVGYRLFNQIYLDSEEYNEEDEEDEI